MKDAIIFGTDGTSKVDPERLTTFTEARMIAGEADSAPIDWGEGTEGEESQDEDLEQASKKARQPRT